MKQKIIFLLFIVALLVFIPISSLMVTQKSQDVRSKAAEETALPVLPPLSPFIRLRTSADHVVKDSVFPVYISAKTNNQSIVEAQIVLSYDPTQFILDEQHIQNDNIFPVLNITKVEPGKVVFSLFVDTQNGYDPVELPGEKTIATIFLRAIGNAGSATVRLIHEGDEKTALYGPRDGETQEAPDVLSTVQDTTVQIQ